MHSNPPGRVERRLVLVGGGHAHVGVLRELAMAPEPGLDVVLVAKELDAPYSGMLPGYVAGHYDIDGCHIDLVRLAHFAGARLIHGTANGVDTKLNQVHILGRPPIAFNILSIDTGITPSVGDIAGADLHAVAVKPVSTFAPRWKALEARALGKGGPRRIAVIGTGAAGFELVLAIRHRLRQLGPAHGIGAGDFSFALIGSGTLLASHNPGARGLARRELVRAGVTLVEGDAAVAVDRDRVRLASGREILSDATLVTTKAAAPGWFAGTGLSLDPRGFLAVEPTLQVVGESDIFAVGDCATVLEHPREKAGVFAVRQAPPLTRNLRLRARGMTAEPFVPQKQFLTLLSCGGTTAIASRGAFAAGGRWAWRLKDHIDRTFMRKFQDLPDPMHGMSEASDSILCAGCAAKLGPAPLARALARFAASAETGPADRVRNLAPRDDAALLDLGGDALRVESIDHFPAIWPEPYVLGEIAAAHALSDILAKGAKPDHALALAGLPSAAAHLQEDDLFQLLAGARAVLGREGVPVVGGHTARAEQISIGFFISGAVARDQFWLKGGLKGGEVLVLTKPLGTGIIFAGWMRRLAKAREVAAALAGMRASSSVAARVLREHGATGVTDVTGFGLAGHLTEMLEATSGRATIGLAQCMRYEGVDRLIASGVRSSLLAENLAFRDKMALEVGDEEAALALLLDPQTSGGLLAGISPEVVEPLLAAMAQAGVEAAAIGVVERGQGKALNAAVRVVVKSAVVLPELAGTALRGASLSPLTAQ